MSSKHFRLLTVSFLAVLIFLTGGIASAQVAGWYDAAWTSRQKITIPSNTSYGLTGNLSDFPFLIKITDTLPANANELFGVAQSLGEDILFTDSDGTTKLPHEIMSYNGTDDLTAWVRIPVFKSGSPTEIYIYYGNPTATNQEQPQEVWSNGYVGVWHLEENGASSKYEDSTSYMNEGVGGTVTTNESPTRSTGGTTDVVGSSQDFDGDDDHIDVPAQSYFDQVPFTVTAWAKFDALPSFTAKNPYIFGRVHTNAPFSSWKLTAATSGDKIKFQEKDSGGADHSIYSNSALVEDTWYQIVGTVDSDYNMKLYIDGLQQDDTTNAGSIYTAD
ncbi:MAG TPA: DUF2341 domain-containing protein, partial [Spirochaetes bacterium]|nr:DUF2341 domain-containing protein [Spirochaetota bacterium]